MERQGHARKPPHKKKRPRTTRISEITNAPIVNSDALEGYITSDDESPAGDGLNRVSWDQFLRFVDTPKKPPQAPKNRKLTWDRGFRQLKKFKKKHGNTNVPRGYGRDPRFELWLDQLHTKYYKKSKGQPAKLSDERFEALQKLGFTGTEPKKKQVKFEVRLAQLERFQREFHHVKVPRGYTAIKGLRAWIIRTRNQFRAREEGKPSDLTDEHVDALNALGFFWNKKKGQSERDSKQMNAGRRTPGDPKAGDSSSRTSKPDFAQRMEELQAFKATFQSTYVPEDFSNNRPGLREWTMDIRKQYWEMVGGCSTELTDGQVYELNEMGFSWDEDEPRKEEVEHGADNSLGRQGEGEDQESEGTQKVANPALASKPTNNQSCEESESVAVRTKSPNSQIVEESFAQRVSHLKGLQRQHIPVNSKSSGLETSFAGLSEPPSLSEAYRSHVNAQSGELDEDDNKQADPGERMKVPKKLTSKTACKIHINSWLTRMKRLKHFKDRHGHLKIPENYPADQQFADWVHEQQRDFAKRCVGDMDALSDERFYALQQLGFEAPPPEVAPPSFDERVAQLRYFFQLHGHVKVPKKYTDAPGLRKWLSTMRSEFNILEQGGDASLSFGEIEVLNGLEFQWRKKKKKAEAAVKEDDHAPKIGFGVLDNRDHSAVAEGHADVSNRPDNHGGHSSSNGLAIVSSGNNTKRYDKRDGPTTDGSNATDNGDPKRYNKRNGPATNGSNATDNGDPNRYGKRNGPPSNGSNATDNGDPSWLLKAHKHAQNRRDKHDGQGNRLETNGLMEAESSNGALKKPDNHDVHMDRFRPNGLKAASSNGALGSWKDRGGHVNNSSMNLKLAAKVAVKEEPNGNKTQDTTWGGRLKQLDHYKALNGHIEVPQVYESDQAFANWVRTQRRLFSKRVGGLTDALSDERYKLLKNIGFGASSSKPAAKGPISPHSGPYQHGSSRGSDHLTKRTNHPAPGSKSAVGSFQRKDFITKSINQPSDKSWEGRFKQLEEFKALNGNAEVPQVYEADQGFAIWVRTQQRLFSKRVGGLTDAMSDERFNLLKNIGFGSSSSKPATKGPISSQSRYQVGNSRGLERRDQRVSIKAEPSTFGSFQLKDPPPQSINQPQDTSWGGRLKQLQDYKALNGTTQVPHLYEADQSFANWVKTQRRLFASRVRGLIDAMSDERFYALQKLGFA